MIGHVYIRINSCGDTVRTNTPVHGVCHILWCIGCNVHHKTHNTLLYHHSSVYQPWTMSDSQCMCQHSIISENIRDALALKYFRFHFIRDGQYNKSAEIKLENYLFHELIPFFTFN